MANALAALIIGITYAIGAAIIAIGLGMGLFLLYVLFHIVTIIL